MTEIKLKRAYEAMTPDDGYRVFVDKLWPRGEKKEDFHYDLWAKDLAPSTDLRKFFHEDQENNWDSFKAQYIEELKQSEAMKQFIANIESKPVVTLLYASKNTEHNQAIILKEYIDKVLAKI